MRQRDFAARRQKVEIQEKNMLRCFLDCVLAFTTVCDRMSNSQNTHKLT